MPGKMEGKRRMGWQRMRWLNSITNSMDINLSKGRQWRTVEPGMLQSTGSQRVGHDWDQTTNNMNHAIVWMFVFPVAPSIHMLKCQTPKVIVLGVGAFGRWAGHEGRALVNEINTHKKSPKRAPLSLRPCKDTTTILSSEEGPHRDILALGSRASSRRNCEQ